MSENINCGNCNDTGITGSPPDQYTQGSCSEAPSTSARGPQQKADAAMQTTEIRNLLKQMRLNAHDHAVFSQIEEEIITRIDAGRATARVTGLEEAALVCESLGGEIDERNVDEVKLCANSLAWHIRRLAGQPAVLSKDTVVRNLAAEFAPQALTAAYRAAVDAEYPLPTSLHTALIVRATDDRAAMWRGINAARRILAAHAYTRPADAPLPTKHVPMVGWTLTEAYQQGWRDARAAPGAARVPDVLDDNDRESIVSAIQKLDELSTGTIAALGSDNLLKNGGPKKATMADVKRVLPYIVSNLRAVVLKLDGGAA